MLFAGKPAATYSDEKRVPKLWALASGKGGVGKSLLASNLSWLLAESDWPTTAADLDFQGANLHTYLGLPRSDRGLAPFLQGDVSCADLLVQHELPGLSLLNGCAAPWDKWPSAAGCRRILNGLESLPSRAVVMDLPTGASACTLDLFIGADLPILVVTPEPACIENAHRFLRGLHLRLLKTEARRAKRNPILNDALKSLGDGWRPFELLNAIHRADAPWAERLGSVLSKFQVNLLLNQVRSDDDLSVGFSLVRAVQQAYGIGLRFMGAVPFEKELWMPLRRRQILLRDSAPPGFLHGLSQIADHGVEGGELTAERASQMSAAG